MQGLMMDRPLTLPSILEYAALYHPDRQVVDRMVEGPIHRYGYADALARTKRMANALIALGVKPGDRVATLAWSHAPALRALFRGHRHRRGAAHHQSAAARRPDRLGRQPRRGRASCSSTSPSRARWPSWRPRCRR